MLPRNSFYNMKNYFQAPWKIKDLLIILAISILLIGGTILGFYFSGLDDLIESSQYRTYWLAGLYFLQTLFLLLPLIFYTKIKYGLTKEHFGLKKVGFFKSFTSAFFSYLLYLGIAILITIFILVTGLEIPGFQLQREILPIFGTDAVSLIISGIIIVILAPVVEELFFRGFLLRTISMKLGTFFGSIVSAIFFALLHLQLPYFIPIFILGLIINSLVIRKKSIYPAIAFHILNNGIAFTVELLILLKIIEFKGLI